MYHFVKFNSTWYLKPECLQDIVDHFTKICGREFKEGFEDFRDNVRIYRDKDGNVKNVSYNHTSSVWRYAVEMEMEFKGLSWLNTADSLEKRTFEDRINRFKNNKPIYFPCSLAIYPPIEHPIYDEEKWTDELIYPFEYNYDEVRFIQWPNGKHWYAKIGKIDIVDKYGRQKWCDKSYAQEIAKKFCECGGDWSKIKE